MAVQNAELAEALWQRTGLRRLFEGQEVDGLHAVGLNPNLRLYR